MTAKRFYISRRSFSKSVALAAAAAGLPVWFYEEAQAQPATPPARSAEEKFGLALVGCGGRGTGVAMEALQYGELRAICDVDRRHLERAAAEFKKRNQNPDLVTDFRKLMERDDIHVILNGTPDHWHTLVNLAAARARKDIYSEKPLTLTVAEGQELVKAVKKYKVVLQTGTQQRSDAKFRLACELVRNRRIGQLKTITVWLPAGLHGGPFAPAPVPEGLDWDYWQGQAPAVPYVKERCHVTFRYFLEYSGGTITDWGAHHNDIAFWATGFNGPSAVRGKVLVAPVPGGYTAPSEYEVEFQYPNGVLHYIKTTKDDNIFGGVVNPNGQRNGIRFEGTEGWIWVRRGAIEASQEEILTTPLPANAERLYVSRNHMENFFECVRSRKAPICDVETGHRSASECHLAQIALRLGRPLRWDANKERFVGEGAKEANTHLARPMRKPYDYSFIA
ncbi:Gfo/Idh/MocA family oxidoreductase [Fontisphaera persica]|uniref:Gfo/Idh/MocA family protein n=1 Tax=Fontisphaera persica TaxID=2974023 RepID=UPI0024BF6A51|nr:Gfo/Idh/MocA family oxidoreductase [Fontisphaera persica]WCJ60599.1 Gfo/Idh/MocA family oxidoreductase [Fontisphaera persica]